MGLKIVLLCTIVSIANGVTIEKIRHTSRVARAAENYDEVPQAEFNSTMPEVATPTQKSAGEEVPAPSTLLSEDKIATETNNDIDEKESKSTKKTRAAKYYDDEASVPSPPAFRRNIVERLSNPSRVARAARYNGQSEQQLTPDFNRNKDGVTIEGPENASRTEREAKLDEGFCIQPAETYDDLKSDEERIERVGNTSRSARQIYSRYKVPIISQPLSTIPSVCCPTNTPPPCCPKTCSPVSPIACPQTCPATCPKTCPTTSAPTCPTVKTLSSCCVPPVTRTSCAATGSGSSQSFYLNYPVATNTAGAYSGIPVQGNLIIADPRTRNQQQRSPCCTAPQRKTCPSVPVVCSATKSACPPTRLALPNNPGTAGLVERSGDGKGGNCITSCMNVLSGPSCCDPCSGQKSCMVSHSGNGCGGNKIKSCINYVTGGNMVCNSGQGDGGNKICSFCNLIGGNSASLVDGAGRSVLQCLCNLVVGPNCSLFGFNSPCGNDDFCEEDDPSCCQPPNACAVDPCSSRSCCQPPNACAVDPCASRRCCQPPNACAVDPCVSQSYCQPPNACAVDPCASRSCCQPPNACALDSYESRTACAYTPISSNPYNPQLTKFSCNPVVCQPSTRTNNYPPCVILPGSLPFYSN